MKPLFFTQSLLGSIFFIAVLLLLNFPNANASTPIDDKETFNQLPISTGRSAKPTKNTTDEAVVEVLPASFQKIIKAIYKTFDGETTMLGGDDGEAIGWAVIPGMGKFYLYQGNNLSAEFWDGFSRSSAPSALRNVIKNDQSKKNIFYLRGDRNNLWKTDEYQFKGSPIWMRTDFVISIAVVDKNTRIEIFETGPSLLPGKRIGMNAHTLKPTYLFDWQTGKFQTTIERKNILNLVKNNLSSISDESAAQLPDNVRIRESLWQRLSTLISSEKLRIQNVKTVGSVSKADVFSFSYEIVNNDSEPLILPKGIDLRQVVQVWRGIEPLSAEAGTKTPISKWGNAYVQGWSDAIPAQAIVGAHEKFIIVDKCEIASLRPGNYRLHLTLRSIKDKRRLLFSKESESDLVFAVP